MKKKLEMALKHTMSDLCTMDFFMKDSQYLCSMLDISSPGNFTVRIEDDIKSATSLSEQLETIYRPLLPIVANSWVPSDGDNCAVKVFVKMFLANLQSCSNCTIRNVLEALIGDLAVVYYEDKFHRAQVIEWRDDDVNIRFVDSDQQSIVGIRNVMPIAQELTKYPPMVVKCELGSLIPIHNIWSEETTSFFQKLVDICSNLSVIILEKGNPLKIQLVDVLMDLNLNGIMARKFYSSLTVTASMASSFYGTTQLSCVVKKLLENTEVTEQNEGAENQDQEEQDLVPEVPCVKDMLELVVDEERFSEVKNVDGIEKSKEELENSSMVAKSIDIGEIKEKHNHFCMVNNSEEVEKFEKEYGNVAWMAKSEKLDKLDEKHELLSVVTSSEEIEKLEEEYENFSVGAKSEVNGELVKEDEHFSVLTDLEAIEKLEGECENLSVLTDTESFEKLEEEHDEVELNRKISEFEIEEKADYFYIVSESDFADDIEPVAEVEETLETFNPMRDDYENFGNALNRDNAGDAIYGYSGNRTCPRFQETGFCYKGDSCPQQHIQGDLRLKNGGYTMDQVEVFTRALNELSSLNFKDKRNVTYIRCINEPDAMFSVTLEEPAPIHASQDFGDIILLEKQLRLEKLNYLSLRPATGELVLVYYDRFWRRARCLPKFRDDDYYDLYLVDWGLNIHGAKLQDMREIREEFLELPFQARKANFSDVEQLWPNHMIFEYMDKIDLDSLIFEFHFVIEDAYYGDFFNGCTSLKEDLIELGAFRRRNTPIPFVSITKSS